MTSLAERAHAAAVFIRHNTAVSPHGRYRGEEHARTAVRLAAALGLSLNHIATAPDWQRRRTTPGEPVLATATCPDTNEKYVFLARFPIYDDEPFELLGPCPECSSQVPLATVRHLADLGTHLALPPLRPEDIAHTNTVPDTFTGDEGHTSTCSYSEIR
ncbi:hypothetical protein BFF78_08205 [Streptomyces fodineus]|uniref:Uncharacterized protein n=1 Tax=Streptomyces fodineus TaxID=1904616 RepID=A0A1D7Y687_9ACTN|nr:hypothetical protein [Streptomyces fodineus]AOR31026.1 hypothetical protein BFF78_08205 [Streptomyces fodineus]